MTAAEAIELLKAHRLWVIGFVVGILALIDGLQPLFRVDFQHFEEAGRVLLSSKGLDVFGDPTLQVGPLHLLFNGLIGLGAGLFVVQSQAVLSLVVQVGFVLSVVLVGRQLRDDPEDKADWLIEGGVATLAVVLAVAWRAYLFGHAGEAFIPLLWILSAHLATRNRYLQAGGLMAVAIGVEPWGVLGVPLLLLLTEIRTAWRALPVAFFGGAVFYAPFALWGAFELFGFVRPATSESGLFDLIFSSGTEFGWSHRLVQYGVVLAIGVILALWSRRMGTRRTAVWSIPIAIAGVRLMLDPSDAIYLWLPFQTAALVGLITCLRGHRTAKDLVLVAGTYPLFFELSAGSFGTWSILLAVLACTWSDRSLDPRPLPPVTTTV